MNTGYDGDTSYRFTSLLAWILYARAFGYTVYKTPHGNWRCGLDKDDPHQTHRGRWQGEGDWILDSPSERGYYKGPNTP